MGMFARGLTAGHTRTRARRERGAVAVEFALIFPILVMIIAGIVTAGLSYTNAIGLANAVREGARFGATADATNAAWAGDVIDRVRATQSDPSSASATAVCVRLVHADAGDGTLVAGTYDCDTSGSTPPMNAADAPSTAEITPGTCVVQVWAARRFEISLILFPIYRGTVFRTSLARYERDAC